jgi:toxin ParE1/3/4
MSSRDVVLLDDARTDLRDISRYTRREWGRQQSLTYMRKLQAGIKHLGSFPDLGRPRPEYGPDVRSLPVEQHRIFYAVSPAAVEIMRIVHMRTSDPDTLNER